LLDDVGARGTGGQRGGQTGGRTIGTLTIGTAPPDGETAATATLRRADVL
jgi:hypothetical protein